MQMRDFVVRFAGEGGQGVVTSAEGLAQTATNAGYHALTFATFPSQILGGPTWTQVRISVNPILSAGDDVDVTGRTRDGEWYRIALADGGDGYVFNKLLARKEKKSSSISPEPKQSTNADILAAGSAEDSINVDDSGNFVGLF